MARIAYLFFDVSMSNGHTGLGAMLKDDLGEDYAIFINKRWTALKMLTPDNVILHLKRPDNQPINPDTVAHLPNCVNGRELDYAKALKTVIETKYKKWSNK